MTEEKSSCWHNWTVIDCGRLATPEPAFVFTWSSCSAHIAAHHDDDDDYTSRKWLMGSLGEGCVKNIQLWARHYKRCPHLLTRSIRASLGG